MKKRVNEAQEDKNQNELIFGDIDPTEPTSVVNGNRILFVGLGARKITMIADTNTNTQA